MLTPLRLLAAATTLAFAACASEPPSADSAEAVEVHRGGDHDVMIPPSPEEGPPEAQGTRPMPQLALRVERVLDEVGEELAPVPMDDGRLRRPRREVLRSVSPRVRASLRRHNVRVEQLARHLQRANR